MFRRGLRNETSVNSIAAVFPWSVVSCLWSVIRRQSPILTFLFPNILSSKSRSLTYFPLLLQIALFGTDVSKARNYKLAIG